MMWNTRKRDVLVLLVITTLAIVLPFVLDNKGTEEQTKECDATKKCSSGGKCVDGGCVYTDCPMGCDPGFYCESDTCVQREPEQGCTSDEEAPPVLFYLAIAASALFVVFLFVSLITGAIQRIFNSRMQLPLRVLAFLGIVLGSVCIGIYPSTIAQRSEVDGKCTGKLVEVHGYARYAGIGIVAFISVVLLSRIIRMQGTKDEALQEEQGEKQEILKQEEILQQLKEERNQLVEETNAKIDENERKKRELEAERDNLTPKEEAALNEQIRIIVEENEKYQQLVEQTFAQPVANLSLSDAIYQQKVLEPLRNNLEAVETSIDNLSKTDVRNETEIATLEQQRGEIEKQLEATEDQYARARQQGQDTEEVIEWQRKTAELKQKYKPPLAGYAAQVMETYKALKNEGGFGDSKKKQTKRNLDKEKLNRNKPRPKSLKRISAMRDNEAIEATGVRPEPLGKPLGRK